MFLMQLFVVEIRNVRRECVSDFVVLVLGAVLRVRQYVTPCWYQVQGLF